MQRDQMDAVIDLAAAMARLTEKQRRVISLWVQGYTQEEIAGIMGVDQATVSRTMRDVKTTLREDA